MAPDASIPRTPAGILAAVLVLGSLFLAPGLTPGSGAGSDPLVGGARAQGAGGSNVMV
jgi:hypothetical protein